MTPASALSRTTVPTAPGKTTSSRRSDPVLRLASKLARLHVSRGTALACAVLMLLGAAAGDAITPAAATFTLFYVVPLGVAVWYVSLSAAYAIGVAAVFAHCAATLLDLPGSTAAFLAWNAAADLILYVMFARLLASLRHRIDLETWRAICLLEGTGTLAKEDALGQLRHAERLATLGKLASGIAHEVGTPLNVISGRAELIAAGGLKGDAVATSADVIIKQAERVAAIVRQLLDFARRGGTRVERTDLTSLVEHTALLLGPLASKAGVEVSHAGPRVQANVNPAEMQQVVTNLLTNAIHALPNGGKVEVSVGVESVRDEQRSQHAGTARECAVIRIRDHGTGIAPDVLPRIFEPFFTTRDVGVGTGLGLSVVYGIMQDHGGWVEVETQVDHGTTMSLYLPRLPAPPTDRAGTDG